jgi:site-specific DNA recombinase
MAEPDRPGRASGGSARKRCAIYTRKSSEEGLDQAFNSLDAQREACAAFVLSQKHEGWAVVPTLYDDGGYSGGAMERPALKRLIADIEAGRVDVVVVYKVDRLTRALSDFARLVEVFDRRGVSFVSITQQFNTTTSMGRLTLNVLLSFAQFEREVIGERVRDKIAASKKKGLFMGGMPPLGYDVKDRKLVVNAEEARVVVDIFQRYLALKSVRALRDELAEAGIRSKRRLRPDGSEYGGQSFSRGALYAFLQNRLYRGEISYKGEVYPGEHAAIVDEQLWDAVQATLAANRVERATGARAKAPSLLAGMIFDEVGERLTPTHAVKKGARYCYYVSASLVAGEAKKPSRGRRIPAGDLERAVIDRLRAFFGDPAATLDALGLEAQARADDLHVPSSSSKVDGPSPAHAQMIAHARQFADDLGSTGPDRIRTILTVLRCRIGVGTAQIDARISRRGLSLLLSNPAVSASLNEAEATPDDAIVLTTPARLTRVGRGVRLLIDGADRAPSPDASLLRIVARAHDVKTRLVENPQLSVHDIAREQNFSAAHFYMVLRLAWLAPDIVSSLVEGRQPAQLSAKTLMRLAAHLPPDWDAQRRLLGFR